MWHITFPGLIECQMGDDKTETHTPAEIDMSSTQGTEVRVSFSSTKETTDSVPNREKKKTKERS